MIGLLTTYFILKIDVKYIILLITIGVIIYDIILLYNDMTTIR